MPTYAEILRQRQAEQQRKRDLRGAAARGVGALLSPAGGPLGAIGGGGAEMVAQWLEGRRNWPRIGVEAAVGAVPIIPSGVTGLAKIGARGGMLAGAGEAGRQIAESGSFQPGDVGLASGVGAGAGMAVGKLANMLMKRKAASGPAIAPLDTTPKPIQPDVISPDELAHAQRVPLGKVPAADASPQQKLDNLLNYKDEMRAALKVEPSNPVLKRQLDLINIHVRGAKARAAEAANTAANLEIDEAIARGGLQAQPPSVGRSVSATDPSGAKRSLRQQYRVPEEGDDLLEGVPVVGAPRTPETPVVPRPPTAPPPTTPTPSPILPGGVVPAPTKSPVEELKKLVKPGNKRYGHESEIISDLRTMLPGLKNFKFKDVVPGGSMESVDRLDRIYANLKGAQEAGADVPPEAMHALQRLFGRRLGKAKEAAGIPRGQTVEAFRKGQRNQALKDDISKFEEFAAAPDEATVRAAMKQKRGPAPKGKPNLDAASSVAFTPLGRTDRIGSLQGRADELKAKGDWTPDEATEAAALQKELGDLKSPDYRPAPAALDELDDHHINLELERIDNLAPEEITEDVLKRATELLGEKEARQAARVAAREGGGNATRIPEGAEVTRVAPGQAAGAEVQEYVPMDARSILEREAKEGTATARAPVPFVAGNKRLGEDEAGELQSAARQFVEGTNPRAAASRAAIKEALLAGPQQPQSLEEVLDAAKQGGFELADYVAKRAAQLQAKGVQGDALYRKLLDELAEVDDVPSQLSDFLGRQYRAATQTGGGNTVLGMGFGGMQGMRSERMLQVGTSALGGLVGGATAEDEQWLGALMGAGAGFAAPVAGRKLVSSLVEELRGAVPHLEGLTSTQGLANVAKQIYEFSPKWIRGNLLWSGNLPANAFGAPWGALGVKYLEMKTAGDPRAEKLGELLDPRIFAKVYQESLQEAATTIMTMERADMTGTFMQGSRAHKAVMAPGVMMTAGDIASRRIANMAGIDEKEARLMTLTSEPVTKVMKGLVHFNRAGGTMGRLLLPFARTIANVWEQGARRLPLIGGLAHKSMNTGASPAQQRAEQLIGTGGLGVGYGAGYAAGDPSERGNQSTLLRTFLGSIKNMAGPASLPVTLGIAGGQAAQAGGSLGEQAWRAAAMGSRDLPLPSAEVPMGYLSTLFRAESPEDLFSAENSPPGLMPTALKQFLRGTR